MAYYIIGLGFNKWHWIISDKIKFQHLCNLRLLVMHQVLGLDLKVFNWCFEWWYKYYIYQYQLSNNSNHNKVRQNGSLRSFLNDKRRLHFQIWNGVTKSFKIDLKTSSLNRPNHTLDASGFPIIFCINNLLACWWQAHFNRICIIPGVL